MSSGTNELITNESVNPQPTSIGAVAESSRAQAEIQAALVIARANPRDQQRSIDGIMHSCQRESLAADSSYSYSRGGQSITGPNIRLMEVIACAWGNIQFGYRVLAESAAKTQAEAFAWDVETNAKVTKPFVVHHRRETKSGSYALEGDRDIYELVSNMASRRIRTCLENIIPRDIVDDAIKQCEETLKAKVKITPALLASLLKAMEEHGITKDQLEAKYQRNFDKITPSQVVQLRRIYASLKDGVAKPEDFFKPDPSEEAEEPKTTSEKLKAKAEKTTKKKTTKKPPPTEAPKDNAFERWDKSLKTEFEREKLIEKLTEMEESDELTDDEKSALGTTGSILLGKMDMFNE